jgi:hypothetical protein
MSLGSLRDKRMKLLEQGDVSTDHRERLTYAKQDLKSKRMIIFLRCATVGACSAEVVGGIVGAGCAQNL